MLKGIIPVIPTPFTGHEELDLEALERLVGFAADSGAAGICLPAYAGESYKLTDSERAAVIRTAVKFAKGRVPILAQSNDPCARTAAEIAQRNAGLGADVIAFAIPRQFALPESEVLRYMPDRSESGEHSCLRSGLQSRGDECGSQLRRALAGSSG
jgi:2-keto-3-deoxy-L-arabinonate dehydratase